MDIQIICMGNRFRRDDGAGVECAHLLPYLVPHGIQINSAADDDAGLVEQWKGLDAVILIEAANSGDKPGTVKRYDAHRQEIPPSLTPRETSVARAVDLAREKGVMPEHVILYAIEGADFGSGADLTEIVEESLESVLVNVQREIRELLTAAGEWKELAPEKDSYVPY